MPPRDYESHIWEAKRENIVWLMTECGYSLEAACAHEEVAISTYQTWAGRGLVPHAERHPDQVS